MTGSQVLRRVEMPNALPLLLSGIRTAMLQIDRHRDIAAYVGLGGLGRYIIDGLPAGDYPQMAAGAVLVGVLAIAARPGPRRASSGSSCPRGHREARPPGPPAATGRARRRES